MQTEGLIDSPIHTPLRMMANAATQEDQLEELCESEDDYFTETQRD